ncbi:hypothetical protein DEO72_LG5g1623 [Vigna unguiculata]|uniref:Uncharacterized protein n=1 Tax=Vigna unguiculata TaxID=3917 RepID=A0A4D6LYY0_VIGUN|nr:hypothetical protein DEO72_LG5g1623 [Vigna unguiculata]
MTCCHTYRPQLIEHQPTEKGNLSGPIRTGHNQHTHTGNTRQPEPQLKRSSCSSAIPSHNSRNTTCLTPIPSHNSKDTFRATTQGTPAIPPLKHHQKPRRSRLQNQQHQYCYSKITWRGTRTARHCPLPNRLEATTITSGHHYTCRKAAAYRALVRNLVTVATPVVHDNCIVFSVPPEPPPRLLHRATMNQSPRLLHHHKATTDALTPEPQPPFLHHVRNTIIATLARPATANASVLTPPSSPLEATMRDVVSHGSHTKVVCMNQQGHLLPRCNKLRPPPEAIMTIPPLKHHQKPRRSRLQNQQHQYCYSKITWRGTRTARHCPLPNRLEATTITSGHHYTCRKAAAYRALVRNLVTVATPVVHDNCIVFSVPPEPPPRLLHRATMNQSPRLLHHHKATTDALTPEPQPPFLHHVRNTIIATLARPATANASVLTPPSSPLEATMRDVVSHGSHTKVVCMNQQGHLLPRCNKLRPPPEAIMSLHLQQ